MPKRKKHNNLSNKKGKRITKKNPPHIKNDDQNETESTQQQSDHQPFPEESDTSSVQTNATDNIINDTEIVNTNSHVQNIPKIKKKPTNFTNKKRKYLKKKNPSNNQNETESTQQSDRQISLQQINISLPTTEKCICFLPGPANRRCPMDHSNIEQIDEVYQTTVEIIADENYNNNIDEVANVDETVVEIIADENYNDDNIENAEQNNTPLNMEVIIENDDDSLDELLRNITFNTPNEIPEPEVHGVVNVVIEENDDANVQDDDVLLINRPNRMPFYLYAINRQNVDTHYCGLLEYVCPHCRAKYFRSEGNVRDRRYTKCCGNGKVILPPYHRMSNEFRSLFKGQHRLSREFKSKIITYNNIFQFASIQANLRQIPGRGPYVYAIQGQVYHHYTDININRDQQKYGPVYYLDPEEATRQRVHNGPQNINLNQELIAIIENDIRRENPYAQQYHHLGRLLEQQRIRANNQEYQIPRVYLEFVGRRRNERRREYDLPQVQEVAAVVDYDEENPPNPSMKVFLTDRDGGFRNIDHQSPHCDPLLYPLLFPSGDPGWYMDMPLNINANVERRNQRVTLCQYYSYRLAYRHEVNDDNDDEHFNVLRYAGRLNQKFIVSAFLKIEANRINYIRQNQDRLRATEYDGLVDYLHRRGEQDNVEIGRMVILPSTYEMSPRNQMQRFQDAMSVVAQLGYPSLFITMTCNPKWREIVENIPQGDEVSNHPLLICRVFKMKLDQLLTDLTKTHMMGVCIAHLSVIEFQKRGLPHAHILITLRNEDKLRDSVRVDRLISAEIPDPDTEAELYELVGQHMIHGPCGLHNPTNVCMDNNVCTKKFPKYWYNNTTIRDGNINYRRRRNGRTIQIRRNNIRYEVDNSYVVPYNPYLLLKYKTHINVEACGNIATVKYLCKYFFKHPDNITVEVIQRRDQADNDIVPNNDVPIPENNEQQPLIHDEIRSYLNGRYLTPPECSWRILQLPMHENSHHVQRLQIHLEGRQNVIFRDGEEDIAANANGRTQLLEWFEMNRTNEESRQWLYVEFPIHFVWRNNRWHRRQITRKPIVSRLVNVSLRNGELYYLRLLLLHVRGAMSYEDMRTVNGVVCNSFQEACAQRDLLSDDVEWYRSLTEACEKQMPRQLRQMFAFILVFGIVDDAPALWARFRHHFNEDYRRRQFNDNDADVLALQHIQSILRVHGRRLSHYGINDPPEINRYPEEQFDGDINIDIAEERREAERMLAQLNDEQRAIFNMTLRVIENYENAEQPRLFFITGPAGTGKTFLYNTILTHLISHNIKVASVSFTGLAAALLKQSRTVHSRFQLPVPIVENSTSYIARDSEEAQFLRDVKLILWDEVSMTTRLTFELVDKTLRFLCGNDQLFGGKVVITGGDFKQCLPIVRNGDRATVVQACIKRSRLWSHFEHYRLQINMRVNPGEQEFIDWLEQLGNNTLPSYRRNLIQIPEECLVESLETLITNVFVNLCAGDVPNKAILTPLNDDCHVINNRVLDSMQNTVEAVYNSVDGIVTDNPVEADMCPVEFLNSISPSGFPQYRLRLKVGCIVMLLRNLNVRANLCNGTRLLIRQLGQNHIEAQVIQFDGELSNERIFIPRVDFISNTASNLPFTLKRRQFPLRVAYALTINKAQGQSFDTIGIYLPNVVFDHGQLYVAFSRARTKRQVFVCALNTHQQGQMLNDGVERTYTKNIVYEEIL